LRHEDTRESIQYRFTGASKGALYSILDILADSKVKWAVKEWQALTSKIESSDLTVGEYLNQFNKRKTK